MGTMWQELRGRQTRPSSSSSALYAFIGVGPETEGVNRFSLYFTDTAVSQEGLGVGHPDDFDLDLVLRVLGEDLSANV